MSTTRDVGPCSAWPSRSAATFDLGVVVGDHGDLGRPGQQVDADAAEQLALRFRHIGVPGADDHVARRFALEAINVHAPAPSLLPSPADAAAFLRPAAPARGSKR